MNNQNLFNSILKYAKPSKGKLILSIICAMISVIGGIIPFFSAYQIIELFFNHNVSAQSILYWSLIGGTGFIIKILFHSISTTLSHISAYTILEQMRRQIAKKLLNAPLGITQNMNAGKIKDIVVDQVENIEIPLAHVIPEGIAAFILPISVFIYICTIDYRMALASLITVPLAMIPYGLMFSGYNQTYLKYMEANEKMNSTLIEYVEGIEVIKAFNQSATSYQKYQTVVENFKQTTMNWYKSTWKYITLGSVILPTTLLGVLPIGALLYISNEITPSKLTMTMLLAMGLVSSFGKFIIFFNQLKAIDYSVKTVNETFDIQELVFKTENQVIDHYNIHLNQISFSYNKGQKVIDNLQLKIPENAFYALVGASGSGKSTLARLIARFWDIDDGKIQIDGINIKDIPLNQLSDLISFVTQDNFLFNCSIIENIRLGNPNASDQEVLDAAKKAQCDDFIHKLENGYHASAGEAGDKLSGGERQRIALARIILKNAPIVILDEATSFTDPENEAKIQEAIAELTKGKTLIVIAHRLSTIIDADQIILLGNGQILMQGTHQELIYQSDIYRNMWHAHVGSKNWAVHDNRKEVNYD